MSLGFPFRIQEEKGLSLGFPFRIQEEEGLSLGFLFWIKEEEGLYNICSKNKGDDFLNL